MAAGWTCDRGGRVALGWACEDTRMARGLRGKPSECARGPPPEEDTKARLKASGRGRGLAADASC